MAGPQPLARVIVLFFAFLGLSLVFGWVIQFGLWKDAAQDPQLIQKEFRLTLGVELVDALLVLGGTLWIGRLSPVPRRSGTFRLMTWLLAVPMLLIALGMNFGYHYLLTDFLSLHTLEDPIVAAYGLSGWVWLAYCVQPAVVEEWFFRYLALGSLRPFVGNHGAVLIAAVMFGMVHIFSPLSIPMLMIIGVVLGYARVASGGMLLPILMHFGHNAAILLLETLL